jgi:CRISPR type III-A-associated RAMP protein Csm5
MIINAEISVISPVLISSGEKIDFKYLFKKNGKYYVVEFDRTAALILSSTKARQYTDRILDKIRRRERVWQDLWEDLDRDGLIFYYGNWIEDVSIDLGRETENIIMYTGTTIRNGNNIDLVPYIPGSTVKGSLRNAIFYKFIKGHNTGMNSMEYERNFKNFFKVSERNGVGTDIMKYIMVSDFFPDGPDVKLGVGRIVRRKIRTGFENGKFQPAIYIRSGKFKGSIGINDELFTLPSESMHRMREKLSSMLGEDVIQMQSTGTERKQIDNRLVNCLVKLLENFTRDVDDWFFKSIPNTPGIKEKPNFYIGFGKGINRNSPAVALPIHTSEEVFRFRRGKYPPSTMSYVRVSASEYLPLGMAKLIQI